MSEPNHSIIDDYQDPSVRRAAALVWTEKWQSVLIKAVIASSVYNIFCYLGLNGSLESSQAFAISFGLFLLFLLLVLFVGCFFGVIAGFLPMKKLPYSLKFPLSTLSGILLVNLAIAFLITPMVLEELVG